jgi:cytochrome c
MDSFETNKVLGAVLFTCLAIQALNVGAGAAFSPRPPAKPGYEIAVAKPEGETEKAAAPAAEEPIEVALATADPKRGEQDAKICQTCHTLAKGEPNKIGPNLWGVVGRNKGSEAGFAYSEGMKSKGGTWTVDDLNKFLTSPREFVPGTKMTFAGFPKESSRANVIAYLNTLSDNPKPLPVAAKPAGGQAAAGGESKSGSGAPAGAPTEGNNPASPPAGGAAPAPTGGGGQTPPGTAPAEK